MTKKIIASIHSSCNRDAARIFNSIKEHHGRADMLIYGLEKKAYRFMFYQDSGYVFIKPITINRDIDQKEEYIVMHNGVKKNTLRKMIEQSPDISNGTASKPYTHLLEILNCMQEIMYPRAKRFGLTDDLRYQAI